ncbi:MAG: LCP family protein [Anaerolineales bacterium]
MKRFSFLLLLVSLLSACAPAPAAPTNASGGHFVPTSTPTPFQPLPLEEDALPTATQPPTVTAIPITAEALPTPQPSPTPTPVLPPASTPQPTYDPAALLPSDWTPPNFAGPAYAPAPAPVLTDNQTVTFLLLGSDTRGGPSFRTDTIVIAAVRPLNGQVTLVSVPRDLWVYIPNHGMDRINTAYLYGNREGYPGGGQALLKDTILYNLGIRIDHLAMVDFNGFRRIVDTLGGIDVPIACPYTDWRLRAPDLDPNNENNWALYTVGPGLVHMDGDLALWYARSRQRSSDFDRGRRQQEVLRAIYAAALRTDAIDRLPQLYADLSSTVTTDLDLQTILQLSPLAVTLTNADIRSYYINREYVTPWTTPAGASVLLPNSPAIQAMLIRALAPAARTPQAEAVVVEIRNGTLYAGWDSLAAERLNYAGYETRLAPADRRDYPATYLYDLTADQDSGRAASLLAVLGLPQSALISAPMQANVSYVVIVGADYQPCFNPDHMAP